MEDIILKEVYNNIKKGKEIALVTITESLGSTPRKKGSIMAVKEDGDILGSIGGGSIENSIIIEAQKCIKNGENKNFHYKLNDKGTIGMNCGGEVKGFIKVFSPSKKLIIVGAGHIGREVYKIGNLLGFHTVVVDDRKEYFNDKYFPNVDEIISDNTEEKLKNYKINKNSYIVIASRNEEEDTKALRVVLGKDASYIGMIGSSKKVLKVKNTLLKEGFSKDELEKVYAPIGLNISSEDPVEIAFGILGEILLIKNKGSLEHLKDLKKAKL